MERVPTCGRDDFHIVPLVSLCLGKGLAERFQKADGIAVVLEDGFKTVATIHHMAPGYSRRNCRGIGMAYQRPRQCQC